MLSYSPIGTIHTPHENPVGMPIQPAGADEYIGEAHLAPQFIEGLRDLDGFSHVLLLYHFHRSEGYKLTVTPFMDHLPHGLSATRAPRRPNPIGLSIVKIIAIEGGVITFRGADMLNGTPLLDIKPHVPHFLAAGEIRTGWLKQAGREAQTHRSDPRFQTAEE